MNNQTTKVFITGNSQAVRIPKNFKFECDEVGIVKVGHGILLYPLDSVSDNFVDGVSGFSADFMVDGRMPQLQKDRIII